MTPAQTVFLALVGLSTLFVVVHLAMVVRAFRRGARGAAETLGLLFPPSAPIVASRHGERALVLAWALLLAAYLAVFFAKAG